MKKIIAFTVAAALLGMCHSALAMVIIATNTVSFVGVSGCTPQPDDILSITYDVTENSFGLYDYNYDLTTAVPEDLTSFTIGGNNDPLDTATMDMTGGYGLASPAGSGFDSNSVGWDWGFSSGVTSDDVSFTSNIAPSYATFTVNDDDVVWYSGSLIPAPVPESSSFALLGASAFAFCLFKYRRTANPVLKRIC